MQSHAITCNHMQSHAITCNHMQSHAITSCHAITWALDATAGAVNHTNVPGVLAWATTLLREWSFYFKTHSGNPTCTGHTPPYSSGLKSKKERKKASWNRNMPKRRPPPGGGGFLLSILKRTTRSLIARLYRAVPWRWSCDFEEWIWIMS